MTWFPLDFSREFYLEEKDKARNGRHWAQYVTWSGLLPDTVSLRLCICGGLNEVSPIVLGIWTLGPQFGGALWGELEGGMSPSKGDGF